MILPIPTISPYTSFFAFLIGLPTLAATYYQSWRTRKESVEAREGLIFSGNCLEFLLDDGTTINLVPLETLFTFCRCPATSSFFPAVTPKRSSASNTGPIV